MPGRVRPLAYSTVREHSCRTSDVPKEMQSLARLVRGPKLDTRSARIRLAVRREPYWIRLGPGRHVGYRRLGREGGTWIARAYDGETRKRAYRALGAADDVLDADGLGVLTFAQAQEQARAWFLSAFRVEKAEGVSPVQTV